MPTTKPNRRMEAILKMTELADRGNPPAPVRGTNELPILPVSNLTHASQESIGVLRGGTVVTIQTRQFWRNTMTTTETTGNAGFPQPPFGIATLEAGPTCTGIMPSGIFCIGALAAPDGQFLYLSLLGRDTAFQELRGKMTTGQLHAFVVQQDGKTVASGCVLNPNGDSVEVALAKRILEKV